MDIKKVTQKDRYGNQVSFEFEAPVKPLDQTAIVKGMMEKSMDESMEVPMMSMEIDHPGEPMGTDTVPAWLTPGEFVVNKEAMDIPGNAEIVEEINNDGRAIQAKKGMEVPGYYKHGGALQMHRMPGGIPMDGPPHLKEGGNIAEKLVQYLPKGQPVLPTGPGLDAVAKLAPFFFDEGGKVSKLYKEGYTAPGQAYAIAKSMGYDNGGWITDELLDKLREVESGGRNDLVSKAGAVGEYQWLPSSAKQAGYGVKAFDPLDPKAARAATAQYLMNMQKHHGFTPEETLRAYNWGPGNVLKHKAGKRKDIPDEALNYPGKILGWDKVEGVPAPAGMPVPKARPEGLGAPETPPSKEEYGFMDFLKEFFKGGGREYNMGGPVYMQEGGWFDAFRKWNQENEARNVDKRVKQDLALNPSIVGDDPVADYEGEFGVPEVPNLVGDDPVGEYPLPGGTVVPALTDVPKGHKMFGGNETFAGVDNTHIPTNTPSADASDFATDEKPAEAPWYAPLLGHRSKEALNIPLNENEQRLATEGYKDYHAFNPSLVGDDPVGEGYEGYGEDIEGSGIKSELETKDETAKKEVKETKDDIKSKVLNKIDIDAKNADGPGADQAGENKTGDEVKQAGESNPDLVEKAGSFLKDTFGDLFDAKELTRMAVMYAGSRALGYGHQGSLRFAAKQYIGRVDSKAAARDKAVMEYTKSGKYSTKSIQDFKKSGDISDLQPVGTSYTPTGKGKAVVIKGKKVNLTEVKGSDGGTYFQLPNGKTVPPHMATQLKDYDPSFDKDTSEYRTRRSRATKYAEGRFEEIYKRDGRERFGDNQWKDFTKIGPKQAASEFWKWAEDNGLDPESDEAINIMGNAYAQAIADGKGGKFTPSKLTPYLEAQKIRETTGATELFITNSKDVADGKPPQYVRGDLMDKLDDNIFALVNASPRKGLSKDAVYQTGIQLWGQLDDDKKKFYNDAAEKGQTGFYLFLNENLAELMGKLK